MKLTEAFPSAWLKADDVPFPRTFTIRGARMEEIGQQKDQKVVIYFQEEEKGLIINKTVWAQIANIVGSDDTDNWGGKSVELFRDMVNFQGKMVPGLRARPPQQRFTQPAPAPVRPQVPVNGQQAPAYAVSDEIPDPAQDEPMTARQRQQTQSKPF